MIATSDRIAVCVPARNEAERLPDFLAALAGQTVRGCAIVLAINNTTDRSCEVIEAARRRHLDLKLIVDETWYAEADAHAGSARRRAMDLAAGLVRDDGFILTTDADTRPPPDWLASNMAAMERGLDIVGGRIVIDDSEPMQTAVREAQILADRYWARVRDIEDAIDPLPWDPPPRHGDHTGASLCVTAAAYRRSGGVPLLRSGEDRALVRAVVRQGGRLAHPSAIWTRVSPRTVGRARGGMADDMLALQANCASQGDIRLPSFAQWAKRAAWRRDIRKQGGAKLIAELEDELPPMTNDMVLGRAAFECTP